MAATRGHREHRFGTWAATSAFFERLSIHGLDHCSRHRGNDLSKRFFEVGRFRSAEQMADPVCRASRHVRNGNANDAEGFCRVVKDAARSAGRNSLPLFGDAVGWIWTH